jgi:hypothetical protein
MSVIDRDISRIRSIDLAINSYRTNPAARKEAELIDLTSAAPEVRLFVTLPDKTMTSPADRPSLKDLYIDRLRRLGGGGSELVVNGGLRAAKIERDGLSNSDKDGLELKFETATVYGQRPLNVQVDCDIVVPLEVIERVAIGMNAKRTAS